MHDSIIADSVTETGQKILTETIEFIEGEDYCRYNGELLTPQFLEEKYGCVELVYNDNSEVELVYNDNSEVIGFHTNDNMFLVADTYRECILMIIGKYTYEQTSHSYDNACDEAHGFSQESKNLIISNVTEMVKEINTFTHLTVFPDNVDITGFQKLEDILDDYYKKMNL